MLVKILIAGGLAVLTVAMHAVGLDVLLRAQCTTKVPDRAAPISAPVTTAFAQTTQDRSVLSLPDQPAGGKAALTVPESVMPRFCRSARQRGAPNVVIVLLDDVGFGVASIFGGPVKTPDMDAPAKEGLRYNRFFDTALRSPTRAALLYFPLLAGRFGDLPQP